MATVNRVRASSSCFHDNSTSSPTSSKEKWKIIEGVARPPTRKLCEPIWRQRHDLWIAVTPKAI